MLVTCKRAIMLDRDHGTDCFIADVVIRGAVSMIFIVREVYFSSSGWRLWTGQDPVEVFHHNIAGTVGAPKKADLHA